MSDRNMVACDEDHELITVLRHFEKRQTTKNIDLMRNLCKSHKAADAFKPHNRESFYRYLGEEARLDALE